MVNQQCGNCKKVISGILTVCYYCNAVKQELSDYSIVWTEPYEPTHSYRYVSGNAPNRDEYIPKHIYSSVVTKEDMDKCELEAKIEELECKMKRLENQTPCDDLYDIRCFFTDKWSNRPTVLDDGDSIRVKVYTKDYIYNGASTLPFMQRKGYYLNRVIYGHKDTCNGFYRTLVFCKIC